MAIKINEKFPAKSNPATSQYLTGSVKNETIPNESNDGTPVDAVLMNNLQGIIDATLSAAGVEHDGATETAIKSQFLESLKILFQDSKVYGGDWVDSNIAGTQLVQTDRLKFWTFNRVAYQLKDSATLPLTAPNDPTTQPVNFQKTEYAPREEIDGAYVHAVGNSLIEGALQIFEADNAILRISSEGNSGKSSIVIDGDGKGSTITKAFIIERDNNSGKIEFIVVSQSRKIALSMDGNGLVDFKVKPKFNGDDLATEKFVYSGYLSRQGGTLTGSLHLLKDSGVGISMGKTLTDRFKIEAMDGDDEFQLYYRNSSSWIKIFEANKAGFFKFSNIPSVNGKELAVMDQAIPTGTYQEHSSSDSRSGWLLCDGSSVSKSTYANLYSVIGDQYGSDESNFNLPYKIENDASDFKLTSSIKISDNSNTYHDQSFCLYVHDNKFYLAFAESNSEISIYEASSPTSGFIKKSSFTSEGASNALVPYQENGFFYLAELKGSKVAIHESSSPDTGFTKASEFSISKTVYKGLGFFKKDGYFYFVTATNYLELYRSSSPRDGFAFYQHSKYRDGQGFIKALEVNQDIYVFHSPSKLRKIYKFKPDNYFPLDLVDRVYMTSSAPKEDFYELDGDFYRADMEDTIVSIKKERQSYRNLNKKVACIENLNSIRSMSVEKLGGNAYMAIKRASWVRHNDDKAYVDFYEATAVRKRNVFVKT